MENIKNLKRSQTSGSAMQPGANDALKLWKKKKLTLLARAKVGLPPHFSSDLFDSLSYLSVKPGRRPGEKTINFDQ